MELSKDPGADVIDFLIPNLQKDFDGTYFFKVCIRN